VASTREQDPDRRHDVKLISVPAGGKKLDVQVDGKVYTVSRGDVRRQLQAREDRRECATFLFGDQSFELCEK
jgi:hypothetical protein